MPLTAEETFDLGPDALQLLRLLREALERDPDGKVRVTKNEAKEIAIAALTLTGRVVVDVVD